MDHRKITNPSLGLLPRLARHRKVTQFLTWLNVLLYRLSGGRFANTVNGCPVCLLTMTGRRSGRKKTVALMYVPHGDEVLLVASLGGGPKHPQWYYNLVSQPKIEVQIGSRKSAMTAHLSADDEREKLWPIAVAHYRPYRDYQARTQRQIPVFRCLPDKSQ